MVLWKTPAFSLWLPFLALGVLCSVVYGAKNRYRAVCLLEDEQQGRCVMVKECPRVSEVVRKENHTNEDIRFLINRKCGEMEDRKVLVCCAISDEVFEESTDTILTGTDEEPPCGVQVPPVRSDLNQTIGHHPWSALLHYGNAVYETRFNCSGTLVAPEYVLTAASCVDDVESRNNLRVRLGEYDLESTVDCPPDNVLSCAAVSYDVAVSEVIVHEAYRGRLNDIALLKLARPIERDDWVNPICLPKSRVLDETLTYVSAGWNQNECENSVSRHKLISTSRIANQTVCQHHLMSVASVSNNFICASSNDRTFGDVGRPLTVVRTDKSDSQKVFELVGVLSTLSNCANYNGIHVYTSVNQYVDWIKDKMAQK